MTKPYGCLPQSIGTSACPVLIDGRLPRVKKNVGPIIQENPWSTRNRVVPRVFILRLLEAATASQGSTLGRHSHA